MRHNPVPRDVFCSESVTQLASGEQHWFNKDDLGIDDGAAKLDKGPSPIFHRRFPCIEGCHTASCWLRPLKDSLSQQLIRGDVCGNSLTTACC